MAAKTACLFLTTLVAALCCGPAMAMESVSLPHPEHIMGHDHGLTPEWAEFLSDYPGSQILDWDQWHPAPHRVLPAGILLPGGPVQNGADLEQRCREFMSQHKQLFPGLSIKARHLAHHGKLWIADFNILADGWVLANQDLMFRVSESGQLMAFGSDMPVEIPVLDERLSRDELLSAAQLLALAEDPAATIEELDTAFLPSYSEDQLSFVAARAYRLNAPLAEQNSVFWLSCNDADVVKARPGVYHMTLNGHICVQAEEQQPSDGTSLHGAANMELDVDGQSVTTDSTGAFSAELNGEGPWWVTAAFSGSWANISRSDGGSNYFGALQLSDGDTLEVSDEADMTERDCWVHINRVHDFITEIDPGFTGQNQPMTVNVNIDQACNAFYNPGNNSTNFFNEGGGCPNTGRVAGVVYHEYGHGINHRQYVQAGVAQGLTNGAMHEGLADVTAVLLQDVNFVSPGWFLRALNNTQHYPEDIAPEVHFDGMIIGGAMWDLRLSAGMESARYLHHFARWGTPDDADTGRAFFEYFVEVLLADDDNGDLSDQTPHWQQIDDAFNAHGIGTVLTWALNTISLVEPPLWIATDENLLIQVTGELPAFLADADLDLYYRVNDGEWLNIPMDVAEGAFWEVELPLFDAGAVVSVYVSLDTEEVVYSPELGPDGPWRFAVGNQGPYLWDFEDSAGGFTTAQEGWQWGEVLSGPFNTHSGVRLWATELEGLYENNSWLELTSPELIVADRFYPAISLYHWLESEDREDGGNLQIQVNGGDWHVIDVRTGYTGDINASQPESRQPGWTGIVFGWPSATFDLGSEELIVGDRLRFRLSFFSNASVPYNGWYVDDVRILGMDIVPQLSVNELPDTEDSAQASFPLSLQLQSVLNLEALSVEWRSNGSDLESAAFSPTADPEIFESSITGPFELDTFVEYRIRSSFENELNLMLPSDGWYSFNVEADVTPPLAELQIGPYDLIGRSAQFQLLAQAEDNLGVATVALEEQLNSGGWQWLADLEAEEDGSWTLALDYLAEDTGVAEFRLRATDASTAGNEFLTEVAAFNLGESQNIDDFESGDDEGWELSGEWALQGLRTAQASDWALGSSDDGFYDAFADGVAQWRRVIDLSNASSAFLTLDEQIFMQADLDFVHIEISTNGGADWDLLGSRTGIVPAMATASFSLEPWLGQESVLLRWRMDADGSDLGLHIGYYADNIRLLADPVVGIDPHSAGLPEVFKLEAAVPNPFNPVTHLDLHISQQAKLDVALYNLLGQRLRVLWSGETKAGTLHLRVDGSNLSSGVYIVQANSVGQLQSQKILLIK